VYELKCGANKEAGLEVRAGKAEGVCIHYHQNAGTNCNVILSSKSFENVAGFRYLGKTATNKKCIHQEIKNMLNLRLAC
jgi:hypothetical protein